MSNNLLLKFDPFPVLESERILLQKPSEENLEFILKIRSDAEIMKYIPRPFCTSLDDAKSHLDLFLKGIENGTSINWIMYEKTTSQMIGIIGFVRIHEKHFRAEVGYMIDSVFNNFGYTSEALKVVLNYGFETINLHSLEAIIDPENIASEKILIKNEFVKEGHFKENEFWNGKFLDAVFYSKLNPNH